MEKLYIPGNFIWSGRSDGTQREQLRWHQVIENIDVDSKNEWQKGFCLIGFKSDLGIQKNKGRIGAKEAPNIVRKHLASMPWHFYEMRLYDAGDVICKDNLETAQGVLSDKVKKISQSGLFPIIIGGGHESAFGSINGIYESTKEMPYIVNFDAHFDIRDYSRGATSGTSFKQIGDICKQHSIPFKYLCIGIQKSSNTSELFNRAKQYGIKWIDTDMIRFNEKATIKKVNDFMTNANNIHLSICMDVFAQSVACGVSAPQPFGLSLNEFLRFFYYITTSGKVNSLDIAETSPPLDSNNSTSALTAHIIFKFVDKIYQKQNYL